MKKNTVGPIGILLFILGIVASGIVMQVINYGEEQITLFAIIGTVVAILLAYLGFAHLSVLLSGFATGMTVKLITFFTTYNPFQSNTPTPHFAMLVSQNADPSFQMIGFVFLIVAIIVAIIFYKIDKMFSLIAFCFFATIACCLLFGYLIVG